MLPIVTRVEGTMLLRLLPSVQSVEGTLLLLKEMPPPRLLTLLLLAMLAGLRVSDRTVKGPPRMKKTLIPTMKLSIFSNWLCSAK